MTTSAERPGGAEEGGASEPDAAKRPDGSERRCQCGYAKGHVMISPVGEYSFTGWFMLLLGISALPHRIRYQCRTCRDTVDEVTDPDEIRGIRLL